MNATKVVTCLCSSEERFGVLGVYFETVGAETNALRPILCMSICPTTIVGFALQARQIKEMHY